MRRVAVPEDYATGTVQWLTGAEWRGSDRRAAAVQRGTRTANRGAHARAGNRSGTAVRGAEDGHHRSTDRRRRARFQQFADGGVGQPDVIGKEPGQGRSAKQTLTRERGARSAARRGAEAAAAGLL